MSIPIEHSSLKNVKNVIIIMSGKGGVGKSFIAASIAIALRTLGYSVAILDTDIHGPSIPWILGIEDKFMGVSIDGGLVPQEIEGIAVASFELLLGQKGNPIAWRGPLKTRAIIELVTKTVWGARDFIVVDTPPGTGDEHMTVVHVLRPLIRGALLVLAPGDLVAHVITKVGLFLKNAGIDLLGAILNMAYFRCPTCGALHRVYGEAGAKDIQIVAEIPIKPELSYAINEGKLIEYLQRQDRELLSLFKDLCTDIILKKLNYSP